MEGEKTNLVEDEKREEAKLIQKYPQHIKPSNFLQKKLNRGQKYFDSGDYNMQKQAGGGRNRLLAQPSPLAPTPQSPQASPVAPAFPPPTVDSIHLQQRKASISQSKLAEESATPHISLAPQSEQLEQSAAAE